MNIKSLLLGSAAAMVAVSGARAADAIIFAEPEPTEYVRICDTYGAGFYYIPGTETCLRVGGFLRYDIGVGDLFAVPTLDKSDLLDGVIDFNETYFKRARFSLHVDARSETELGTLRGFAHINFDYDSHGNGVTILGVRPDIVGLGTALGVPLGISTAEDGVNIEHAFIELGGFRVGKTDSLFSTFTGYAGGVINDAWPGHSYGPFGTHQISYTFSGGNGFTAAIALEEGAGGNLVPGPLGNIIVVDAFTIDSYVPHIVGGVGFTQAWGGISAVIGYDSVHSEWAGKIRGDVNLGAGSLFLMAGWKSDDATPNYYGQWGGDWAIWGGGSFDVTETASINVQLSYDDADTFAAVANIAWTPVENFTITPEIAYVDADGASAWGGYLRFQRNF